MNENWDSDVRADMSDALDKIVVEDKGASVTVRTRSRRGSEGASLGVTVAEQD